MARLKSAVQWGAMVIGMISLVVSCAKKPDPQESCNFVRNADLQRVSWKASLPVQLYIHESVPPEFYSSIQQAAEDWNKSKGRDLIKIVGVTNKGNTARVDGANIIYWMDEWDKTKPLEQARTVISWQGPNLVEADIMINAKNFTYAQGAPYAWGAVDFESLIVHEMGHALGLAHVEEKNSKSVMEPTLASATLRRTPELFDVKSMSCEY